MLLDEAHAHRSDVQAKGLNETHRICIMRPLSMCINPLPDRFNPGQHTPYIKKNRKKIKTLQSGSYFWPPPGHPDVQRVVAARLGVGQSAALFVGVQQGAVLFGKHQRHHHGGTTHQSRLRDEDGRKEEGLIRKGEQRSVKTQGTIVCWQGIFYKSSCTIIEQQ